MPPKPIQRARINVDGVDLGAAEVKSVPAPTSPGPMDLKLSFRPNWVGIWKLQAQQAESMRR